MDFPCWLVVSSTDPSYGHPNKLRVNHAFYHAFYHAFWGCVKNWGWMKWFVLWVSTSNWDRNWFSGQIQVCPGESTWRTYGRIDHLSHWSCWDHLVHHSIHTYGCLFHDACSSLGLQKILTPKHSQNPLVRNLNQKSCGLFDVPNHPKRHQGISALSQAFTDKIAAKTWLFTILRHPQILILKVFLNSGKKKTSMDSLHLFCFCQTSSQSQGCPWHSAPGF